MPTGCAIPPSFSATRLSLPDPSFIATSAHIRRGSELMDAAVNQAPKLWGTIAVHAPFVNVLNTMLDDSLPLIPIGWPEWGNSIKGAGHGGKPGSSDSLREVAEESPVSWQLWRRKGLAGKLRTFGRALSGQLN